MRDFPSCFGENGVQVADASCSSVAGVSKAPQNLVTCVYQCRLLEKSCLVTVVWSKNLMGQCLSVEIEDLSHQCLCKVDVKPSLFSKRKGSKSLEVNSCRIDLYWDLSVAKLGSGPEPLEGYYLALVCNGHMALVVGDLRKEAFKKTNANPQLSSAMFISKREHIFGKRVFGTRVQFCDNGPIHDLFRGNYTILVDGLPVEVFWDVHNWLFGTNFGNAVFMFQTCLSAEKLWKSQSLPDHSVLPWPYSESFSSSKSPGVGFSLILYAWKNE
nr:Thiosulfate/3-mercaptopyruvate sulfurtransferase [Ipomoea batatas]